MNLNLLLKEPAAWTCQNGYYAKINSMAAQCIMGGYTADLSNIFNEIDEKSWWIKYRTKIIIAITKKYFLPTDVIFDIGGGNGIITKSLSDTGLQMVLLEPSIQSCVNAKKRGLNNIICGTLNDENFNSDSIKAALILDVLEHIKHDNQFLKCLHNKIQKGGKIVLTVPAFNFLYGSNDKMVGHFRRYSLKQIETAVETAGFSVIYSSYFLSFLIIPVFFVNAVLEKLGLIKKYENKNVKEKADTLSKRHQANNKIVAKIISFLNKAEIKILLLGKKIPFGNSIILVAGK